MDPEEDTPEKVQDNFDGSGLIDMITLALYSPSLF